MEVLYMYNKTLLSALARLELARGFLQAAIERSAGSKVLSRATMRVAKMAWLVAQAQDDASIELVWSGRVFPDQNPANTKTVRV